MTNSKTTVLSEKAYRIIKERLINYEQGKYLSARNFASEINMSYTPVREAFLRLQKEGFLERVPSVGFFVIKLDVREILEIFQVRECIESYVFEVVFDAISESDLQKLDQFVIEQKSALEHKNVLQYVKSDEQFHMIFFSVAANKQFINIIRNIREKYMLCSTRVANLGDFEGIAEHEQIIQLIREKNKEKAVDAMIRHIYNAKQRMKEGFINEYEFSNIREK